tara:strand:+ start:1375 stop:2262 length:888 start_codon:yes stop_codon:yes gene_type:complete
MKYTNKHDIPKEIIRAIENDQYTRGNSDISVTGLLQPPRIRLLEREHHDDIVLDYSDETWKILGQAVHAILERANENYDDTITEQRLFADIEGWTVSGQTDSLAVHDKVLKDYKVTSVWTVVNALKEGKSDWEKQLNCYAYLYKLNTGETINQLNIIAIARDWNRRDSRARGGDYPQSNIITLDIPLWSEQEQLQFFKDRVSFHRSSEFKHSMDGELPLCSDEDRWKREDTFRVVKKGRKRAIRVLPSLKEAEEFLGSNEDGLSIEISKGESIRCGAYCNVAQFCNQYKEELANG